MTDLYLPLMSYLLTIGKTIDIINYDVGESVKPIYNETNFVESPLSSFNASYYVLPDDNIPYGKAHIPVDLLLRIKFSDPNFARQSLLSEYSIVTNEGTDQALILVVAECKTSEKTVKEGATPVPNWQNNIRDGEHQTHYVDKIVYGGRVVGLIRIRSIVKGDIQIFRRILKDIMGTSGTVGENTVELWKKAEKAIRESPDIRGQVYMDHYSDITNGQQYDEPWKIENLLEYVSKFPQFVRTTSDEMYPRPFYFSYRKPVSISLKPLHDLDERYPLVQKDMEGEKYLAKLYQLLQDVEETQSEFDFMLNGLSIENENKYEDFVKNLSSVTSELRKVFVTSLSAFQNVDKSALQRAFNQYQNGLDNTTKDYLTQLRRLREKIVTGIRCSYDYFTPARGLLRVEENEMVKKGAVENLKECQYLCEDDERCRAVGYSEKECLIYYRSTNTAAITLPGGDSDDMKIYDRKCKFIYRNN